MHRESRTGSLITLTRTRWCSSPQEGRPEGRSEEEVEATVERWTAYLHPRAKEAIIGCRIWGFEKFSNSSRDFVRGPMVGEGADGAKLED